MLDQIEGSRKNWEIVGYIQPVIRPPVIVEPVLRDTTNPEKYFFAKDPSTDVRSEVEHMPKTDENGAPFLGAPSFKLLPSPIQYRLYCVCIYHKGTIIQARATKAVADFVENNDF